MFEDHPEFSRKLKEQILLEWWAFVRSGFEYRYFTPNLHWFLSEHGPPNFFGRNIGQENFWRIYFDNKVSMLGMVIQQFTLRNVLGEGQDLDWWARYESPVFGDLMGAMVEVTGQIGAEFPDILDEYEEDCLQAEIDQRRAAYEAAHPDPSTQAGPIDDQAIYEEVQVRAMAESFPITPALRQRLMRAAQDAAQPLIQPPLFGLQPTRAAANRSADTLTQTIPPATSSEIETSRKTKQTGQPGKAAASQDDTTNTAT